MAITRVRKGAGNATAAPAVVPGMPLPGRLVHFYRLGPVKCSRPELDELVARAYGRLAP